MPTQTPKNLDAWLKLLDSVRLPVPRESFERVRMAISDSRRSLRDIAQLMQQSPALALSVLREANHRTHGSLAEPAENLEIALTRLGLARTQELLERLPVADAADIPHALRHLQMISQHATEQANGLFANRLARLWQDIHWGSLLFLAPMWPLALAEPYLVEAWELRVIHKGESPAKVEMELFGIRLLALCEALADIWRLPAWVSHGYKVLQHERDWLVKALHIARDNDHPLRQQQLLDADPALRRWLNQPPNTVLLANGLALASQQGWDCPHTLRWEFLTCLFLQMPLDELQQQVHQQAVQSARLHGGGDLAHPALTLIWPWATRHIGRALQPMAPPSAEALATWRKICTELLVEPSRYANALHLTTQARDALQACGMQRVMMLMVDKTQSHLRVHQVAGLPAGAAEQSVAVNQNKLIQRLLSQPAQIRLTPDNYAQFEPLLPNDIDTLFKGEHLLLRSLSSNGRVVMVVIADQGGHPFSEISVQAFGKTAQCIERALASFSNRSQ